MTDEAALVSRLAARLSAAGVRYFITGSIAAMYYGEARATRDVDVAVFLRFGDLDELAAQFPEPEFFLDRQSMEEAMKAAGQFNVIDNTTGMKIDFMCVEPTGYDRVRLERAMCVEIIAGVTAPIAAPEDVILKKLEYFQRGGSDKHLRDIASMIKVSGGEFDRDYLARWALANGVHDEWTAVKARVGW